MVWEACFEDVSILLPDPNWVVWKGLVHRGSTIPLPVLSAAGLTHTGAIVLPSHLELHHISVSVEGRWEKSCSTVANETDFKLLRDFRKH